MLINDNFQNYMEKKNNEIEVRDYQMVFHLTMAKVVCEKYSGVFVCEGKPLDGKKFFHELHTKIKGFMKYGKTTSLFYLDEPNSKSFRTMDALVRFYNKGQ